MAETMLAGIGHNSGRVDESGKSWRRHVWTKARKELMPTLPLEVVRLRVRRAAELGLPYKAYAGIRASTGHDLIGFLFSNNALQVLRDGQMPPEQRAAKLARLVRTTNAGVAHHPVTATHLGQLEGLSAAFAAPRFDSSWSDMRNYLRAMIARQGHPADRLVIVGDTALEREWADAARTAGYLSADQFFSG